MWDAVPSQTGAQARAKNSAAELPSCGADVGPGREDGEDGGAARLVGARAAKKPPCDVRGGVCSLRKGCGEALSDWYLGVQGVPEGRCWGCLRHEHGAQCVCARARVCANGRATRNCLRHDPSAQCMHAYVYIYVYISCIYMYLMCVCVCMYMYIYVYICTYMVHGAYSEWRCMRV